MQAFALSDDHAAQQRVFGASNGHRANPRIRHALTEGEIPATDPRLCFVGLEAYEAAGGLVRRDLFDDDTTGYAQHSALLDRLVADKLATLAESIRPKAGAGSRRGRASVTPTVANSAASTSTKPHFRTTRLELDRLRDEHDALLENAYAEEGRPG